MQSYIQYRNFRKQLRGQYERGHDKPNHNATNNDLANCKNQNPQRQQEPDGNITDKGKTQENQKQKRKKRKPPKLHRSLELSWHNRKSDILPARDLDRVDYEADVSGPAMTLNPREVGADKDQPPLMVSGIEPPAGRVSHEHAKGARIFVVSFETDTDPLDPHNWSLARKIWCTVVVCFIACAVEFGTVADSPAIERAQHGKEPSASIKYLLIGSFLIGMGAGSLISGPFSEFLGRNQVYVLSLTLYNTMCVASHLIDKRGYRLVVRLFAGVFGSGSSVCTSGAIADIWSRLDRTYVFPIYTGIVLMGPLLASIIGPILVEKYNSRLDLAHIAFGSIAWLAALLFQPETYGPVLLYWKARQVRLLTQNPRFRAAIELKKVSFMRRFQHALVRPWLCLIHDRTLGLITIYMAVNYVVFYQLYSSISFILDTIYHFSLIDTGIAFLTTIGGLFLAAPAVAFSYRHLRNAMTTAIREGRSQVKSELVLLLAHLGGPTIPMSLFWVGFTSKESINPAVPLAGTALFSSAVVCMTVSSYQYVADSFELYFTSAQAVVLFFRYITAGIIAEFSVPIFKRLGIQWSLSIFAFISLVTLPIPFYLYRADLEDMDEGVGVGVASIVVEAEVAVEEEQKRHHNRPPWIQLKGAARQDTRHRILRNLNPNPRHNHRQADRARGHEARLQEETAGVVHHEKTTIIRQQILD
ncbi:Transporter mfs1 [Talaromyces islandicus]|uniref:Transporter mfs1 n=1 Tax=Talaromyces islandicus TaxID=28573 RepID=A0A0U1M6B5_TALIS|nr:Transporter mfs1 [Talaromyces islandicus]